MKRIKTQIAVLMMAVVASSGCSVLKKRTPKTPVLGERVAVLTSENDVEVDPATAAVSMVLPAPITNAEWGQSGGNPSKSMSHVALGSNLGQAFSVSIGEGSSMTARLGGPPFGGGRVPLRQCHVETLTPDGGQVGHPFGTRRA